MKNCDILIMYALVWELEDAHFCSTYTSWYRSRDSWVSGAVRVLYGVGVTLYS